MGKDADMNSASFFYEIGMELTHMKGILKKRVVQHIIVSV